MPIYFTCHICVKSHRPTPQTSTPASPGRSSISRTCGTAWLRASPSRTSPISSAVTSRRCTPRPPRFRGASREEVSPNAHLGSLPHQIDACRHPRSHRSADRREGHRGLGREIRHHRRTAEEPSGGAAGEMRGAGTYRCGWLAARTDRTLGLTFLSLLEVTASILRGRLV